MTKNIKPITQAHIAGLKNVLDSCELFPSEYLDDMIADYLNNANAQEIWYTYMDGNIPVAIGYCVPEKFTNGTYNLLAIGVSKNYQRKGVAKAMMLAIEQQIKNKHGRILIVETSSSDAQMGARQLYEKMGYTKEAVIRAFWNDNEDKIVFWKRL